jgi:hypothetical protein
VAIYHSRVDYPGYVPPTSGQFRIESEGSEAEAEALTGRVKVSTADKTGDLEMPGGVSNRFTYKNPADIPVSPGGEIEDEAIDRSRDPAPSVKKTAR